MFMKKLPALLLIAISIGSFAQRSEQYFRFIEKDRNIINEKITRIISIDKIVNDTVYAYANVLELERLNQLGYKIEKLLAPSLLGSKALNMATDISQMALWNRYPTYEVYRAMLKKFEQDYPMLCKLDSIGTTVEGRKLYVLKISDNVSTNETEPEAFYSSTIHGDEVTGFVLMLRLADYLLSNYNIDPRITAMVDNMAIYINPNANPDGTYYTSNATVSGATRYNANNVDLNRNFPDPRAGDHPDGNSWQPENQAMMSFAEQHKFVVAANFHGGIELANYPWDTWTSTTKKHPDHNWYYTISRAYADTAHKYSPTDYFTGESNGVTHGGDWYVVAGGRQDYMNYWHNCREITLEISDVKLLNTDLLPAYWNYNKASILNYLDLAYCGFYGTVKNAQGDPLNATITVLNHDKDNSFVKTNPINGNYYRPIDAGTYSITYSALGYTDYTISNVLIETGKSKTINVVLNGSNGTQSVSGVILNRSNNQPIPSANVTINSLILATTNANGEFTANDVPSGIIKIDVNADGFYSATYHENLPQTSSNYTIKLVQKQTISGHVYSAETSQPLEGVTVSIIDGNGSTISNSEGFFQINNLYTGNYQLKLRKTGFISKTMSTTLPLNEPMSVSLVPTKPEGFESTIPEGITFTTGNWTRDNTTAFEGTYSLKSATISHSQQTAVSLTLNLIEPGEISFARRVSSESGYDFLKFYIDGVEKGIWSGELTWSEESYPVTSGNHTFQWKYTKDEATTSGNDCAWIDNISIPNNSQTVNFNVRINGTTYEGISVVFNNQTITTNISGAAVFNHVEKCENQPYKVLYQNKLLNEGTLDVLWADVAKDVNFNHASSIIFEVKSNGNPVSGATVNFNQTQQTTNNLGIASFASVPFGINSPYNITMSGYGNAQGSIPAYKDSTYSIVLYPTDIENPYQTLESFSVSPNPFKDKVQINCKVNKPTHISIEIFDISGRTVLKIEEGIVTPGEYNWHWTLSKVGATRSNSNVYFVRLRHNDTTTVRKLININ